MPSWETENYELKWVGMGTKWAQTNKTAKKKENFLEKTSDQTSKPEILRS